MFGFTVLCVRESVCVCVRALSLPSWDHTFRCVYVRCAMNGFTVLRFPFYDSVVYVFTVYGVQSGVQGLGLDFCVENLGFGV